MTDSYEVRLVKGLVALTEQPLAQLKTAVIDHGQIVDRWVNFSTYIGQELPRGFGADN